MNEKLNELDNKKELPIKEQNESLKRAINLIDKLNTIANNALNRKKAKDEIVRNNKKY